MEIKEKITLLAEHNLNWFEIADILDMEYNQVRLIDEEEDEN